MLSEKQKRFIEEYMVDMCGRQAAIRAGYPAHTAVVKASQLLTNPYIQELIAEAKAKQSTRCETSADDVLREYAKIAFSNIKNYVQWTPDGNLALKDSEHLPDELTAAIESVSQGKYGVTIKLHNKINALDALSRHLQLDAATQVKVTHDFGNKSLAELEAEYRSFEDGVSGGDSQAEKMGEADT